MLLLGALSLLSVLLSGCFLRALSGAVQPANELLETNGVVQIGATSVTSKCYSSPFNEPGNEFVECIYHIEGGVGEFGSFDLQSTSQLISEFGLFGVLIDPVILQVPEDAYEPSGTFTDTSFSTTQPVVVTEADSFNVQPGVSVAPEAGQKFFILEFPTFTDTNEVEYDFDFTFKVPEVEPVNVKAMFAGRVNAGGYTYYIPLLPCTTDFADVPEFTIPVADTPQDLMADLLDYAMSNDDIGCDGQTYDFNYDGIWGDDDCSLAVATRDPLKKLMDLASIDYEVFGGDCHTIGDSIDLQFGFGGQVWGDTNCDGEHNTGDVLQLLRYFGKLPVTQQPNCPPIGEPVLFQP
jgi:hypothetical protein